MKETNLQYKFSETSIHDFSECFNPVVYICRGMRTGESG